MEAATITLDYKNHLMRQNADMISPLISQNADMISPSISDDENSSLMIAGQLIIYDLDEEPPTARKVKRENGRVIYKLI